MHGSIRQGANQPVTRQQWLLLGLIVVGAVLLRLQGLHWLLAVAPTADFSYMMDDQRFVELAKDFSAGTFDGYPYGMTTQLLALQALISPFVSDVNLLHLLRVVTLIYAALTLVLTFFISRSWGIGNGWSLLAVFLLATAPTHVVTSNYGTADVTAVFFFYLALFVEGRYLITRKQVWFVVAAALTGAAIAIKLFLPLLVPLGLIVLAHKGARFFTQALLAAVVVLISFEALSLFSYEISDLMKMSASIKNDNISIQGGNGPVKQLVLYTWDLVSAVSIPVFLLGFAGLALWVKGFFSRVQPLAAIRSDWRSLITPETILLCALAAHGVLLIFAGIHAVRHLLVFVPATCIAAAFAAKRMSEAGWLNRPGRIVSGLLLIAYAISNAVAVEALYVRDIRNQLGAWAAETASRGRKIVSVGEWTQMQGVSFERRADLAALGPDDYLVTCDLEFNGYLRSRDAKTYNVFGGQPRTDFYWNVLEGRADFRIVKLLREEPLSIEQWLIDRQFMRPIGTFVPKRCLVLGRNENAITPPREIWPRVYYTSGW